MTLHTLIRILVVALAYATPAAAADCSSLSKFERPGVTIDTADVVPAGGPAQPNGPPLREVPAFCRVAGVIRPSTDSEIQFEVWLPNEGWNGKFQGVGNGGYAGSIQTGPMAAAVRRGYATASTDTGHRAGATDAAWALGHPQKVLDFGSRAIHETTAAAKAIVAAFYGGAPKRSYFAGCSNGGRQALMEAQRYPADYDGIIAGAPANDWIHLFTGLLWTSLATSKDPAAFIPPAKLPLIESAALSACDAADGVKDGIINDPSKCRFDPSPLLCMDSDANTCLTAPQVAALKKIYSGPVDAKGRSVFPGYAPGGETGNSGWPAWITGTAPASSLVHAFGSQFFINMVYEKADWDYRTFDVDRDTKAAADKLAAVMNATDPDLRRFQSRGGKLIVYQGWSDAAVPPRSAINYYRAVQTKMGAKAADGFVRLYMAPGMQHCAGGPGPDSFGAGGAAQGDAQHDMSRALEHWVEDGAAPDSIIATKYKTGTNPASGVTRTRPLCPYPLTAQYKGTGSTDDAANFACAK